MSAIESIKRIRRIGITKGIIGATFVVSSAIMLALVQGPPVNGTEVVPAAYSPPSPRESYEMHLRAEFGFRHELSYIRAVRERPDTGLGDMATLGMPMTPEERAGLDRRRKLGELIAQISSLVNRSTYAGAWIDQQAGGVLNIAYTDLPLSTEIAALTGRLPLGSRLVIRHALVSLDRLESLQSKVMADLDNWRSKGVVIVGSEVNEVGNDLLVRVSSDTNQAKEQMAAVYGPGGLVVEEATGGRARLLGAASGTEFVPSSLPRLMMPIFKTQSPGVRDSRSGPLFGGTWINSPNPGSGTPPCTVGYANATGIGGPQLITADTVGSLGPHGIRDSMLTRVQGLELDGVMASTTVGQPPTAIVRPSVLFRQGRIPIAF
ncbi:MAG TPA: hypothetical protein VGM60_07145 [Pseudonocardia sp.]|uniref:hypothetical protein n=1 Tax=Pseudonocardia sp. TaxID=60912 RepID=UPI002F426A8B